MTPEQSLWRDVIGSLFKDFKMDAKKCGHPDDIKNILSKYEWETETKWFRWLCDNVDIHPDHFRRQLIELAKEHYERIKTVIQIQNQNEQALLALAADPSETLLALHGFSTSKIDEHTNDDGQLQFRNIL